MEWSVNRLFSEITSPETATGMTRRKAIAGLFGCVSLLAACGGGGGSDSTPDQIASAPTPSPSPAPAPSPAPSPAPAVAPWTVGPLYFAVGSGATLDLAATLPNGVK